MRNAYIRNDVSQGERIQELWLWNYEITKWFNRKHLSIQIIGQLKAIAKSSTVTTTIHNSKYDPHRTAIKSELYGGSSRAVSEPVKISPNWKRFFSSRFEYNFETERFKYFETKFLLTNRKPSLNVGIFFTPNHLECLEPKFQPNLKGNAQNLNAQFGDNPLVTSVQHYIKFMRRWGPNNNNNLSERLGIKICTDLFSFQGVAVMNLSNFCFGFCSLAKWLLIWGLCVIQTLFVIIICVNEYKLFTKFHCTNWALAKICCNNEYHGITWIMSSIPLYQRWIKRAFL